MNTWHKLDNAAKLFPAVKADHNSSTFRVSMIMKETVQRDMLQAAASMAIKRFPMLAVEMKKGTFWNYLDEPKRTIQIEKEENYPCYPVTNGSLLRIIYFHKRISLEIFHGLTDGAGAVEFLKTVAYSYLKMLGHHIEHENLILLPEDFPDKEEYEDSYTLYFRPESTNRIMEPKSFQITGTPIEPFGNNVIHGVVSASKLNEYAKSKGATITGYLTAILIRSIYMEYAKNQKSDRKVMIAVPVSLRKSFPSKTIRNFFSVMNIGTELTEQTSFDTLLMEVMKQLTEKTNKKALEQSVSPNVRLEKELWIRFIPLFIKHTFLRYSFEHFGDSRKTLTLSNLGKINLPRDMGKHIERMEAVVYPTAKSPINCGICSINDKLTITFTRRIMETDAIKHFFRSLADQTGLRIEIYSNEWGIKQ
ncbi:alcohol acetyltransferase [Bacillus sp. 1P06AnD]|uniref:alcohol acetyltransferase n=1 Tax=Bacillus sp. 1P06AnD TaxID=3132208 RepID=UPI0039A01273